ncbi:MAG: L,D-transpeptidase family protein [Caldicoprobacter oshimai]
MVLNKLGKDIMALLYVVIFFLLYVAMEDYSLKFDSEPEVPVASQAASNMKGNDAEQYEGEYNIFIDLTESMLYLFKGNKLVKKYPIAQGKPSTPSPIGVWEIVSKARNWGSGFGTRWMGLNVPWGTYGIHGTNRPESIGRRASAGCFRMRNRDVEELYDLVPYRTKVVVYGGPFGNLGSQLVRLEPGDRNSHVLEVQKRLKRLGYYQGSLDGIYGEGMKYALLKFKKEHGLPVNHYVDWATYKALGIIPFE